MSSVLGSFTPAEEAQIRERTSLRFIMNPYDVSPVPPRPLAREEPTEPPAGGPAGNMDEQAASPALPEPSAPEAGSSSPAQTTGDMNVQIASLALLELSRSASQAGSSSPAHTAGNMEEQPAASPELPEPSAPEAGSSSPAHTPEVGPEVQEAPVTCPAVKDNADETEPEVSQTVAADEAVPEQAHVDNEGIPDAQNQPSSSSGDPDLVSSQPDAPPAAVPPPQPLANGPRPAPDGATRRALERIKVATGLAWYRQNPRWRKGKHTEGKPKDTSKTLVEKLAALNIYDNSVLREGGPCYKCQHRDPTCETFGLFPVCRTYPRLEGGVPALRKKKGRKQPNGPSGRTCCAGCTYKKMPCYDEDEHEAIMLRRQQARRENAAKKATAAKTTPAETTPAQTTPAKTTLKSRKKTRNEPVQPEVDPNETEVEDEPEPESNTGESKSVRRVLTLPLRRKRTASDLESGEEESWQRADPPQPIPKTFDAPPPCSPLLLSGQISSSPVSRSDTSPSEVSNARPTPSTSSSRSGWTAVNAPTPGQQKMPPPRLEPQAPRTGRKPLPSDTTVSRTARGQENCKRRKTDSS